MSRSRDEWLARQTDADRSLPQPRIGRVTATRRLLGGWDLTVQGEHLVPLGGPGGVIIGGEPLEDVRFTPKEITGRLRELPPTREVIVDTAVARVSTGQIRIAPRDPLFEGARLLTTALHRIRPAWRRLLGYYRKSA